jgi:hypothetical protein
VFCGLFWVLIVVSGFVLCGFSALLMLLRVIFNVVKAHFSVLSERLPCGEVLSEEGCQQRL